ncbi:hypothetical protein ACLGIH_21795 [Streptomyces sp. HMX87]|uniref:hypothetical protein n=1 Tax=Streptomyces sp. HMX87 TaxID=3390849 RepID=UPI003A84D454
MRPWWRRVGAPVAGGMVAGVLTTAITDRAWGWDLAARCLVYSAMYAVLQPLLARSRRRAAERDEQQIREFREARRTRQGRSSGKRC